MDPDLKCTEIHFRNLMERYGTPIIIYNLLKTKEQTPHESKVTALFEKFIGLLKYKKMTATDISNNLIFNKYDFALNYEAGHQDLILEDL